ncbi:F-box/FBD/LRR-repeat protein [Spatholobus suberectus]|nr:F-box/FBD/LRR-repeat protein [Spatholobus suberectus]
MADCGEHIDRISDLPRNVIDSILQYLPIQDLVKTSILSRKWRYMWASVPQLQFENNFFENCKRLENLEASSIITEVLLLHNGPVHKFTLHIPSNYPIKIECLSKWILFLSRKGIKDLELVNLQTDRYQTPSHIFSFQALTYLQLDRFKLLTPPDFCGFKSLFDLRLFHIKFESGALESLLSGCPLLVQLTISYCNGFDCVTVSAPTLKVLYIKGPKVIKSICLKQAQNLIDLTLWADRCKDNVEGGWVSDLMKGLLKIERLCLGRGYTKILSAINPQVLLRSVDTLKYLELSGVNFNEEGELLFTISLLESSPNLEKLVIKSNSMAVESQQISKEFDCINCYFNQLQTVKITVKTSYKPALDLIRFVLASSPALKILTFKVGLGLNQSDAPILLSISRDLLKMERASPRAQVKFLYDGLIK